ncbi:GNAT superfamily N-acetyltransferase [Agrobacterium vitis]|nr:GNAT superfamily N-acetyltransferase [Agrobacterium vitis]MBE1437330.1 GNAT superfamily N-acetyltransferase [Agrobacterium vitis]
MTERLWTIRFALPHDIEALHCIETQAAHIFQSLDEFSWLAQAAPLPTERQSQLIASGTVFVATTMKDKPIGFLTAEVIDNRLHIVELSVLPDWQRMGIGRALIDVAKDTAISRRLTALTLTTFRTVPWNAPFYAELGFEESQDEALQQHLKADADHGLPYKHRCAMALTL